jgi:ketosteroid isomerase-like protein
MRILMHFRDRIVAPDGYVYENEGMEYIRLRGGRIREIRVALDTEKVAALDAHL